MFIIKVLMPVLVFLMFVDNASAGILMRRCCNGRGCTYQRAYYPTNADLNTVSSQLKQDNSDGKVCTDITTDDNNKVVSTLPDPSELYPDLYAEFTGTSVNKEQPETAKSEETLLADDLESPDNIKVDFIEGVDVSEDSSEVSLTKADAADKLFEKKSLVKTELPAVEEDTVNEEVTEVKVKDSEVKKEEVKEVKEETSDVVLSEDEAALIKEVNDLRTSRGLSALTVSKTLMDSSRAQSDAMNKTKRVYHFLAAKPNYVAQSIVSCSSVEQAMYIWKYSNNGNYANIMNPYHKYIGVANTNGFFTLQFSSVNYDKAK